MELMLLCILLCHYYIGLSPSHKNNKTEGIDIFCSVSSES